MILLVLLIFATMIIGQANQGDNLKEKILLQSLKGDNNQLPEVLAVPDNNQEKIDDIISPQTQAALKAVQLSKDLAQIDEVTIQAKGETTNRKGEPAAIYVTASRGTNQISQQDLDCLARIVHSEARGETYEGMVAVASVVLNRVDSKVFGKSIQDVIFQSGAFTAVSDGQYYLEPDETSYRAAKAALNGWDPTGGAIYYWNPAKATSKWVRSRSVTKTIGKHVFAH